jgi:hypothetical protein
MCWTHDDLSLITVGGDGAVYEWSMDAIKTGERKREEITKGIMVDAVACGVRPGNLIASYSKMSNIKERLNIKSVKTEDINSSSVAGTGKSSIATIFLYFTYIPSHNLNRG